MKLHTDLPQAWKPIPGYPGYEVSDNGVVRSARKETAIWLNVSGYRMVKLWRDGKSKNFPVHRIVIMAHKGPIPPGMAVCHVDGNKTNNALSNLKVATYSENEQDKKRHGTSPVGSRHGRALISEAEVPLIRSRYAKNGRRDNAKDLGFEFGLTPDAIRAIVNRKTWKHVD